MQWQRRAETATERPKAGVDADVVHVGGVPRGGKQQQQDEEEIKVQIHALRARPLLASRTSFSFVKTQAPGTGPQQSQAARRPNTAPGSSTDNRKTPASKGHTFVLSNEEEDQAEILTATPRIPAADRRCFSPFAPRGARNRHVWIDRRSPRSRRQDDEQPAARVGSRWVGCAEKRWKVMRSGALTADLVSSAWSTHARGANLGQRDEKQLSYPVPGNSQAESLHMKGFKPVGHGRKTVGHPLHNALSPFNRRLGRVVVPWKQIPVGSENHRVAQGSEARKPKQRPSLYAYAPEEGTPIDAEGNDEEAANKPTAEPVASAEKMEGWGAPRSPTLSRSRQLHITTLSLSELTGPVWHLQC